MLHLGVSFLTFLGLVSVTFKVYFFYVWGLVSVTFRG